MNVDCWLRDCHFYLFLIKLRGEKFTQMNYNEGRIFPFLRVLL